MMSSEREEMSFLQHLEVLRWHLVRSAIAISVVAITAFLFKEFIFDTVLFAPKREDFITFRALCKLSVWLNGIFPALVGIDTLCIGKNIPLLQNINLAGQFTIHITTSFIAGLVVAFPYVFWEFWRFISPAFNADERRKARGAVFFTSFLFLCGIAFGYFVIAPLSVNFLSTYTVSDQVLNVPTLSNYISTVTTVVLACGVLFELPVIVYFLTKVGLVSPTLLRKFRRHSFVGALVLASILTPPDVFSQLLVTFPLVILYEISIIISQKVYKNPLD
jgi:sec-independent protein translocase protein TatC